MSETTLAASVAATDASITVTDVDDLAGVKVPPYQIAINRETMKVTDVSGAVLTVERGQQAMLATLARDTFDREEATRWNYADDGVNRWRGATTGDPAGTTDTVTGGYGVINVSSAGVSATPMLEMSSPVLDAQVRFPFVLDSLDVLVDAYLRTGTNPGVDSYRARLNIDGAGAMSLRLSKNVSSVNTALVAAVVPPGTVAIGDEVNLAFQTVGTGTTSLAAKAWRTLDGEPAAWQTTTTDTEAVLQTPNFAGLRYRPTATGIFSLAEFLVSQVPQGVAHANGDRVVLVEEWEFASTVVFGFGAPVSNPPSGATYIDVAPSPPVEYRRVGADWYTITLT